MAMALPCVTKVPQAEQRIIKELSFEPEAAPDLAAVGEVDFVALNRLLIKLMTK
jgi:hypothetical protein